MQYVGHFLEVGEDAGAQLEFCLLKSNPAFAFLNKSEAVQSIE